MPAEAEAQPPYKFRSSPRERNERAGGEERQGHRVLEVLAVPLLVLARGDVVPCRDVVAQQTPPAFSPIAPLAHGRTGRTIRVLSRGQVGGIGRHLQRGVTGCVGKTAW